VWVHRDNDKGQIVVLFRVAHPVPQAAGQCRRDLIRRPANGLPQHRLQPFAAKFFRCGIERFRHTVRERHHDIPR
jgi:hypothetical protein